MFESLSDKLQSVFKRLRGKGSLTEVDVSEALREVRLALLEADVNFKVVKDFIARVRERAVGEEVTRSLTPAQQVIKIVHEELVVTLGERTGRDVVIVDTAGRLAIDAEMMAQAAAIREAVDPTEVLLVVDAMTGQDAVATAQAFQEGVEVTGFVL